MLGKIPVSLAGFYYAVKHYNKHGDQEARFWYFLGIGILFNPLLPVHLFFQPLWIIADIVIAIYFYKFLKNYG